MNKTKIGICTIGAVVILAGSCMIGKYICRKPDKSRSESDGYSGSCSGTV